MHDFVHTFGGVADDPRAAQHNTAALNHSFRNLRRGDKLHVPEQTFYVNGGIEGVRLHDVTIIIDGRLLFSPDVYIWPHAWGSVPWPDPANDLPASHPTFLKQLLGEPATERPRPCPLPRSNATRYGGRGYLAGMAFSDCRNLTLTSSNRRGELNGNGRAWWSLPGFGYLVHQVCSPRQAAHHGGVAWTGVLACVSDIGHRRCTHVAHLCRLPMPGVAHDRSTALVC